MKNGTIAELSYEKYSRGDFTIWLALFVGIVFLIVAIDALTGGQLLNDGRRQWIMPIVFVLGLGAAGYTIICLVFNTSRGCLVDEHSQELIWWHMKFESQDLRQKSSISLKRVHKIRLKKSSEGIDISLYDLNLKKQKTFNEKVLPSDYENWVGLLVKRWPHIQVERV